MVEHTRLKRQKKLEINLSISISYLMSQVTRVRSIIVMRLSNFKSLGSLLNAGQVLDSLVHCRSSVY